jgi:hypothetical protein
LRRHVLAREEHMLVKRHEPPFLLPSAPALSLAWAL